MEKHYLNFHNNRENLFDLWEKNEYVGSSISPSVYISEYRKFIFDFVVFYIRNNTSLLSIGSGLGRVEKLLLEAGTNVVCIDIIPDAVKRLIDSGLDARLMDAFNVSKHMHNIDVILLDGVIGHLATSFNEPYIGLFSEILYVLKETLSFDGTIIFSDDTPFSGSTYELHTKGSFIRVSDEGFEKELNICGISINRMVHFKYHRPEIGAVTRRIVSAHISTP